MPVNGVNTLNPSTSMIDVKKSQGGDTTLNFADFFNAALDKVNSMQLDSEQALDDFATGKTDNIHEVMIAVEKADLALQFTMQVRNKILDAYNEIMRIQI